MEKTALCALGMYHLHIVVIFCSLSQDSEDLKTDLLILWLQWPAELLLIHSNGYAIHTLFLP
jgi:hypothetical protein